MNKLHYIFILLLTFFAHTALAQTTEIDAKAVVEKAESQFRGYQSYAEVEMKIIRKSWSKNMTMKTWYDGSNGADKSLVLITSPAKEKGTAFLKVDKDVWNWQPKIERVIKMPPSMMGDSWMGSDFSNDDIVQESSIINDYTHSYKKDTTIEGKECYKIELIPHEDAPVVWGKIHMYITKNTFLQLKVQFYDEDFELINTMEASDIGPLGGKTLPRRMTITPADKEGQKTELTYKNLDFKPTFQKNFFTVANLKRMRQNI